MTEDRLCGLSMLSLYREKIKSKDNKIKFIDSVVKQFSKNKRNLSLCSMIEI